MELNLSETRVVIDALKIKMDYLEKKQANLDDYEEDRVSGLSNDIYQLEILTSSLIEDYNRRINELKEDSREFIDNPELESLSSVAV